MPVARASEGRTVQAPGAVHTPVADLHDVVVVQQPGGRSSGGCSCPGHLQVGSVGRGPMPRPRSTTIGRVSDPTAPAAVLRYH